MKDTVLAQLFLSFSVTKIISVASLRRDPFVRLFFHVIHVMNIKCAYDV